MTGFGRQELDVNDKKIIIEIQSLNSKSLEVKYCQFYKFQMLEHR